MLIRKRRFDIEKLPPLPMEVWLLIFQLATEVPFAFLPKVESPFDLPPRPTHKQMTAELSRSLLTKRYVVLVCKAWNEVATPLLYNAVLLRSVRGVRAAWDTFCDSEQSARLGHYVKRIDLSMRDSRTGPRRSRGQPRYQNGYLEGVFWAEGPIFFGCLGLDCRFLPSAVRSQNGCRDYVAAAPMCGNGYHPQSL